MAKQQINSNHTSGRMEWVDSCRGLCMMAILWFHTEMYYIGTDILPYELYVTTSLTVFFIISGFLFARKEHIQLQKGAILSGFSLRHKLHSILRGIVIPYFVFTLLLSVPKSIITGADFHDLLLNIFIGRGSWFVCALAFAEVIFAILHKLHNEWLAIPLSLAGTSLSTWSNENIWCADCALFSLFFLYIGFLISRYYKTLRVSQTLLFALALLVITAITKYMILADRGQYCYYPLHFTNPLVLYADLLCSGLLLMLCNKLIFCTLQNRLFCKTKQALLSHRKGSFTLQNRLFCYIGRYSLYFYFFCGAVPTAVALLMQKLNMAYSGNYLMIIPAFILVIIVSCIIVKIIVFLKEKILTKSHVPMLR